MFTRNVTKGLLFMTYFPRWTIAFRECSISYNDLLDCRDLIRQMLDPNEETRITGVKILENIWCKKDIDDVLNEMRRPSLVEPPIVSSRRRSTRTPNAPQLPPALAQSKK